jgi:RNA polymerase sigma-70 factor (ECF subfamily)
MMVDAVRNTRPAEHSVTTTVERRFVAMYERCARQIQAYCARRIPADRVDDAVAETFLVAWRRIGDVPEAGDDLLWLYRVAGNVVRHDWRSASRKKRLADRVGGTVHVQSSGPADRAIISEEHARVCEALSLLEPDDAELMALVAWECLATSEVAEVLGIAPNTASQRIGRARKRLVERYEQLGDAARRGAPSRGGGT